MYTQIKNLPELVEVHIVCERTEHLDQFKLPNIHCLKDVSPFKYLLEKLFRIYNVRHWWGHLYTMTENVQAQIIHSHFGHIGWADMMTAKQARVKHIVTFYGADVNKLPEKDKSWISRYSELFNSANSFLCEGPYMANALKELGCSPEKIKVHHLGVNVDTIPYKPRYWESNKPLRFLIAASFREKKGITYALEAIAKLQNEVSVEVTIIGDANSEIASQEEKQRILRIIGNSGLQSKTKLLGYQPYSVFFLEAYNSHIYLSPSVTAKDGDTEGGAPVSIIEMMATGMPVVSTNHCDIPEVIQYGISNWLVEERDVSGLLNKIRWLIDNQNEWKKISLAGRKHVEKNFNARRQGFKLSKIYSDLLTR
jgi:colanic acid/amylovoran biosynthesis glycosyltransferase